MSFQPGQTDAPASTTAGFTRTGRRSKLAVNTSAAASTVQLAVLRCVTTSCRRPLAPVRTHIWPGFQDSVVSVWTATRAHGVSRLSIRFSLHLFCMTKRLMTSGLWLEPRCHWKAKPGKISQMILFHITGASDTRAAQASDPAGRKRAGQRPDGSQIQRLGKRTWL